jgi:hypothetical protein
MFRHIEPLGRVWSGSLCSLYHRSPRWITFHCMYLLAHHPQRYTPRTAPFYFLILYSDFYYYTPLTVSLIKNYMVFNCGFIRTHCSYNPCSFGHTIAIILVFATLKIATWVLTNLQYNYIRTLKCICWPFQNKILCRDSDLYEGGTEILSAT